MKMQDIDHTHPHTGTAFGRNYYDSGAVAADGGHETDDETMEDVDHDNAEGAERAFERGTEGRGDSV